MFTGGTLWILSRGHVTRVFAQHGSEGLPCLEVEVSQADTILQALTTRPRKGVGSFGMPVLLDQVTLCVLATPN